MWRCATSASSDFLTPLRRGFSFALLQMGAGLFFFLRFLRHVLSSILRHFSRLLASVNIRILPAAKRALLAFTALYSTLQLYTAEYSAGRAQRHTPQHRRHLERLTVCTGSARPTGTGSDAAPRQHGKRSGAAIAPSDAASSHTQCSRTGCRAGRTQARGSHKRPRWAVRVSPQLEGWQRGRGQQQRFAIQPGGFSPAPSLPGIVVSTRRDSRKQ